MTHGRTLFTTALLCISLALTAQGCGRMQQVTDQLAKMEKTQEMPVDSKGAGGTFTHTVMIYIVGSDLESTSGAASIDIQEMAANEITSGNTVLLMTGGSAEWMIDAIPNDKTMIYRVDGAAFKAVEALPVQNMGNADTLKGFLEYAYNNYPADSFGLVIWDHGAGPMEGVGFDELHEYNGLTLAELREALGASPFSSENKLEWLGFDACLMSSVEAAYMLSDYTKYMIASQETEPGYGWNYAFLQQLGLECTTGDAIGRRIIDDYMSFYKNIVDKMPNYDPDVTLSCLDLSEIGSVEAALDELFACVDADLLENAYSEVAKKRNGTKSFGSKSLSAEQSMDLIDIADLCAQLEDTFPKQARALEDSIKRMVVYNAANVNGANGISMYYPFANKLLYEQKWKDVYENFDFAPNYTKFIRDFSTVWMGERLAQWDLKRKAYVAPENENTFCLQLTPEQVQNYAGSSYFILMKDEDKSQDGRDAYMMLLASGDTELNDEGLLTAGYDRTMAYMVNEEYGQHVPCILIETGRDESSVQYKSAASLSYHGLGITEFEFESAWFYTDYDLRTQRGRITGVQPLRNEKEAMYAGKREIDLRNWSYAGFVDGERYVTYDEDGHIMPYLEWEYVDCIRGWDGLTVDNGSLHMEKGPIEDLNGEYACMIVVRDTQGNSYASELLPVRMDDPTNKSAYIRSDKDGNFTYDLYGDHAAVTAYTGNESMVIVPDELGQQPVTVIGVDAFKDNKKIVEIAMPDTVVNINAGAFGGCESLQTAILPLKLEALGTGSFSGCTGLTSVTLPHGLKTIDNHAFGNCKSLSDITIPGTVKSIGDNAFYGARLRQVTMGSGVKYLGNNAFENCALLTQLEMPDSVEYIGFGAINGCNNIKSIFIPAGIKRIREGAFTSYEEYSSGKSNLTDITVDPGNSAYVSIDGVLFDGSGKTLLAYPGGRIGAYDVPDGVEDISPYAFCGCEGLLDITFPESLRTIGRRAFAGCSSLTAVTLPDGLKELEDGAFQWCSLLTDVYVGRSLSKVGEEVFDWCNELKTIELSPENKAYAVKDNKLVKK